MRKYAYGFIAMLMLAGCASLGLPTPETFNEKLAAGYVAVTAARESATALLNAEQLSPNDGQNVLEQTDHARQGLDIAREIHDSDPAGGSAKLQQVIVGLTAVNVYLCSKRGGKYVGGFCRVES